MACSIIIFSLSERRQTLELWGFVKGIFFLRESARNNKSWQKVLNPAYLFLYFTVKFKVA